ncbi:MAG: peptidase M29 [Acidimicrobiia bacterium]|nr:peptidase M29 [Acidimicrobiia bacterium]
MLVERIEGRWIDAFEEVFRLCGVADGEVCAVLSESQSRQVNVNLAELALDRLGARPFHVVLPTPRQSAPVAIRSTGASEAIGGLAPVVAALNASAFVVDCTVEGLLHAPELGQILREGPRVLMVSNEHPELLERMKPDPTLEARCKVGIKALRDAETMTVTSEAGTDLRIDVSKAMVGGGWGYTTRPGSITHWPGGLCLCFPAPGSVNGTLVMAPGDINLTFKRYLESPITLTIEDDYAVDIAGSGFDAALMRSYFEAWGDREAYAVSHVGWGMNTGARWDGLAMYDRSQVNGTEQRAFGGNFLYSTGANEHADRFTQGHFDLPLRNCTVALDGTVVVERGVLQGDLA